uniref:Putative secreted protein n=1 Tax=Panstrongylus lignarius TaxID=156445 RepID=A0A224Y2I2_9HEMI
MLQNLFLFIYFLFFSSSNLLAMSVKSSSPSEGGLSLFLGKASSGTEGNSGRVISGDIFDRGKGFGCSLVCLLVSELFPATGISGGDT